MMNLFLLAIAAITISVSQPSESQSVSIHKETSKKAELKGQILDAITKEPITGAIVCIDENLCVYTDFKGEFHFSADRSHYRLRVKMVSYQTYERELEPNDFSQSELIIQLEK